MIQCQVCRMWRATKLERRGSEDKENTIDFEEMKPSLQSSKVGVLVSCCHMCDNACALSIVLIIMQLLSFLRCALYVHKEMEVYSLMAGYTSMLKYILAWPKLKPLSSLLYFVSAYYHLLHQLGTINLCM